MPRNESYSYRDSRPLHVGDSRPQGFFICYRSELAHLVAADCSRAAILLYLFLGTHCSGNRAGFKIGGSELTRKLHLGRATIYRALAELIAAGVVRRRAEPTDGPQYELASVQGEPWPTDQQIEGVRTLKKIRRTQGPKTPVEEPPEQPPTPVSPVGPLSSHGWDELEEPSSSRTHLDTTPFPPPRRSVDVQQRQHPMVLTRACWELLRSAEEWAEDPDVWGRWIDITQDDPIVTKAIEILKAAPFKGLPVRRRWVAAAIREASRWGPAFDVDGPPNGDE